MPYIPPQVVQEVKRMDLLTYLKNYEPYELVHFSGKKQNSGSVGTISKGTYRRERNCIASG